MRWLQLIAGILFLVLGYMMFGTPVENLVSLSLFICIALIVSGVGKIIIYFASGKTAHSGWVLADGIISFLLGLWVVISGNISILTAILPYVFAVWLLASSVVRLVGSFVAKDIGLGGWIWILITSLLGIVAGFILMFSPMLSALTLSACLAWIFIINGFSDIAYFFNTSKA